MNMICPVSTIDDMYHACDPDKPLDSAQSPLYQDLSQVRGQRKSWINNIVRNINRAQNVDEYFNMLFSGHRGSGKTTELHQLRLELEQQNYFVIYLDIETMLDMNSVEYQDVLLAIAGSFYPALEKIEITLDNNLLQSLHNWFSEKVIETEKKTELSGAISTEVEAGLKTWFGGLKANISAILKNSSNQRESVRQKVERDLSVFKLHLTTLVTAIRQQVKKDNKFKDLVIIVDGLEKILFAQGKDRQYSNHYELFMLHAEQLKWINSHIIYTVPITLASQTNLRNEFSEMLVMPMVKVESDEGKEALFKLIEKRLKVQELFENPKDVYELIKLSGGAIRDLMILLRNVTETDAEKITQEDVKYARSALIKFYSRQLITLTDGDKQVLQAVHKKQSNQNMESYARLTYSRVILEYENGELWQALHPAVLELESIKTLLNVSTNG
jgi:hypothetical protein